MPSTFSSPRADAHVLVTTNRHAQHARHRLHALRGHRSGPGAWPSIWRLPSITPRLSSGRDCSPASCSTWAPATGRWITMLALSKVNGANSLKGLAENVAIAHRASLKALRTGCATPTRLRLYGHDIRGNIGGRRRTIRDVRRCEESRSDSLRAGFLFGGTDAIFPRGNGSFSSATISWQPKHTLPKKSALNATQFQSQLELDPSTSVK